MARVGFMGTPDFAVPALKKLIELHDVVGVVTQPDRPAGRGNKLRPSPVKVAAVEAGLPVYQPESLRKRDAAAPIRDWQPDVIIVAAFGQILRNHLLNFPQFGCLNLHASLLPRWRGASPIQRAIWAGDAETGVCLMHMDRGLDTGAVYSREAIAIRPNETAQTLHDRLAELGGILIERDLPRVLAGELTAIPQPDDGVTYAAMISKQDGAINWTQSAVEIDRQIRALTPWPAAFTTFGSKQLKIGVAQPLDHSNNVAPGTVVRHDKQVAVVTGEGLLQLGQIQLQGKRAAKATDFVNGRPNFIGTQLGATSS